MKKKAYKCQIVSLDSLIENKGIGSKLLEKVIETAEKRKCKRIWLVTTNDNIKAIKFYQKRGFDMVAVHRNSLRKGLQETIPDYSLLSRYVKLGGEKVTVGSDAHAANEIASDFEYAENLIEEFKELKVGVYKEHEFVAL